MRNTENPVFHNDYIDIFEVSVVFFSETSCSYESIKSLRRSHVSSLDDSFC